MSSGSANDGAEDDPFNLKQQKRWEVEAAADASNTNYAAHGPNMPSNRSSRDAGLLSARCSSSLRSGLPSVRWPTRPHWRKIS